MSVTAEDVSSVNTDALTERIRRRDVRAFYRGFVRQFPSIRDPFGRVRGFMMGLGLFAVVVGVLALAAGISETVSDGGPTVVTDVIVMSTIAAIMVIAGGVFAWVTVRSRQQRGNPKRHYRLARFAADNGMHYLPGPMSGSHLTPWAGRGNLVLRRVMRPMSPRPVEFANYELLHSTEKNLHTQFGGVCAIRLATPLPHILLASKTDETVLPANASVPVGAQRLSLEGDFDRYFTLYCPADYERDALYLFTPDVMARLIDNVRGFDVEIIDDWLFLVSRENIVTFDPERWRELLAATGALTEKIVRWERWRDDRVEAPAVDAGDAAAASDASSAPTAAGLPSPSASSSPQAQAQAQRSRPRVAERGRRLRVSALRSAIIPGLAMLVILGALIIAQFTP